MRVVWDNETRVVGFRKGVGTMVSRPWSESSLPTGSWGKVTVQT